MTDVRAAKEEVPVSEAQPECLFRISSAWAWLVGVECQGGRKGGGVLC